MKRIRVGALILCILAALYPVFVAEASRSELPLELLPGPWQGSYQCNQGLTRLSLAIRVEPSAPKGRVEADFVFSPDPANPAVPVGSFLMAGKFDETTGLLELKPVKWVVQPVDPSYRMIELEGRVRLAADGTALIRGAIKNYGCKDFTLWQFYMDVPATSGGG